MFQILFNLYHDEGTSTGGSPTDVVTRELLFPYPVETDQLRISVVEGDPDVLMRVDLMGMTAEERYGLNPYMDARIISRESNFDPLVLGHIDVREDKIGPGGSLDFYFTSGSKYDIPSLDVGGREVQKFGWVEVKKNVKSLGIFLNYVVADQMLELEWKNTIGSVSGRTVRISGVHFKSFIHLRVANADGGAQILVNGKVVDTVAEVLQDAPFVITHYKWDVTGRDYRGTAHRIARNGAHPNGVADLYGYSVKESQEADSDFPDLRKISADIKMPWDNAIVAVYRREDKYGYIPFQFTNKCYHTSSGNARCFPESGTHGEGRYETGFGGGKNGRLVDAKCLSGYVFFGLTCSRPLDTATRATHAEAEAECGGRGDMLYFPPGKMQNVVFREAFRAREEVDQAAHTVWLGIRRAGGGRWVGGNGQPVPAAAADWADGQPIVAGDCAVADAALGYKWRATSCEDSHTFICSLRRPNCPRGYKHSIAVNNQGGTNSDSCFRVVGLDDDEVGGGERAKR